MTRISLGIGSELALLLTLLLGASSAQADALLNGMGHQYCSEFLASKQETKLRYFDWAQGYMDGLNEEAFMRRRETEDVTSKPDAEQMSALQQYCSEHPKDRFFSAVLALYGSLLRQENHAPL